MQNPFTQTAQEMQRLAEATATRRDVATKAISKVAIGRGFVARDEMTVGGEGDNIRLTRETDNSLRIVNDVTDQTVAYFYRTGRSYVDLTDSAIENRHIGDQEIANRHYGTDSIDRNKIANDEIIRDLMNNDTRNQSQGTSSMREIGSGTSTDAAGRNHTHGSVNFKTDYTDEERDHAIRLRREVEETHFTDNLSKLEPLRKLLLDLAHQLIDDPHERADSWQERKKNDDEFRHDFLMKNDPAYYAAWMLEHNERYAELHTDDERIQRMASHARERYNHIAADPEIVEKEKERYRMEFSPNR